MSDMFVIYTLRVPGFSARRWDPIWADCCALLLTGSIREENGIRWHVCPYCPKEFKKPSDLVRHIRIHTHEKPFKCKQCFRAFAVKSTLTAHMKTHTGIKAFTCQCCMKCFSTSGSMKVHMRLHTGELWGVASSGPPGPWV